MPIEKTRAAGILIVGSLLVGLVMAHPVGARLSMNTIDGTATLNPSGHNVVVTGPVGCDADEIVHIRVEVTQFSTGAVAEGTFHARCTGNPQPWSVHAATHGRTAFEPGAAHVEAWAHTVDQGEQTDFHNWGRTVELVERFS